MSRVLVVAAHPDDEILGVGGTLVRHIDRGDDVRVVIVADCESVRTGGEARLPGATVDAARVLGLVDVPQFLGQRGMTLDDGPEIELNRVICDIVERARPDVVYTHHPGDLNSDHRAVARAVMIATRPCNRHVPERVLCFETPSSTEQAWRPGFEPTVFVDVVATIERKLDAMKCYDAELRQPPHPRSLEALRVRAAYWGQHAGCSCAEPLVLMREIWR